MFVDYKFRKRTCDLPMSNEDWQFENPIASGKITGRKPMEIPKLNLAAFLPQNREVESVNFLDLSMDKQVKMVAEGYNGNGPIADLRKRLGVSQNVLYDRIDRARAIGLITKERVTGGASRAVVEQEAPEQKPDTSITPEFFKKQAEHRRVKAEGLNQQAKRLEQASAIATALEELLGNDAQDLVNGLYVRVS